MLGRAGYSPPKHLGHISKIQKKEGADSIKLGAVSGQQYKAIFKARAFDQYFFQIPPKKSTLDMMSEVARKILSKDPAAEAQRKKDVEEAQVAGGQYHGKTKQKNSNEDAKIRRIGFKETLFGPPGLAPPQHQILNSEGRHKYFSYDGDWEKGHMNGFGTYRFADGATYEGVMRNSWPNGEGTSRYANGGVYVGRWKDGKHEGYGVFTYPTGTVYEGTWHEGKRSGKGMLKHKSGSRYEGDFFLGQFHGRGRFESANLKVTYEGWWVDGFVRGHGTLTMPDGTKLVRSWPAQSRFGGGLSLRGALELVLYEREQARLDKLDERQALYGVSDLAELQFRVNNVRREIAERRALNKAEQKAETIAKRKAAKLAMMEKKLNELLQEEKEAEPDDIEKFMM
ncbi:unnamed protein product [Ectocarpus sp. 13 AM-2016]